MLVLTSIDKFITIAFPNLKKINKNLEILFVIVFNFVYLSPYAILCEKKQGQYSNATGSNESISICQYPEFYIDIELVISILIPFIAMLVFSILLVKVILQVRLRILNINNRRDRNRLKKDIKFAVTNISLNIMFICLDLPFFIIVILKMDTIILNNFHALTFCMNFYVLFITNSIFRHEILRMFGLKKTRKINRTKQTNSYDRNTADVNLTVL